MRRQLDSGILATRLDQDSVLRSIVVLYSGPLASGTLLWCIDGFECVIQFCNGMRCGEAFQIEFLYRLLKRLIGAPLSLFITVASFQ